MFKKKTQEMRNAGHNDRRSLCSDQYPASGRSSKASIGIVAEKYPKVGSAGRKDNAAALPNSGILSSCQEKAVEENKGKVVEENRGPDIVETIEIRQAEPDNWFASAWFSSRSVHREMPTGEVVQFYGNQASVVQSEEDLHNKLDTLADGKRIQKGHAIKRNRVPCTVESLEVKQLDVRDKKSSACFSSRSVRHKTPTTEAVEIYKNHTSVVQSEDCVLKKSDTMAYGKRRERGENTGGVEVIEEVIFATMQEEQLPDKTVCREEPEQVAQYSNEALKLKLSQILGSSSSLKKNMNSPSHELEKEGSKAIENGKSQPRKESQPKHNSDTIETFSESPNQIMRRPITRSVTRKKNPPRTESKLWSGINNRKDPLSSSGSDLKFKLHENVFSFDEEKAESLGRTRSGHSNRYKAKKNEQNITRIEPQDIYSHIPMVRQKGLQSREREQTLSSPEKESLTNKGKYGSPSPSCRSKNRLMRTADMPQKTRIRQPINCLPRQLIPEKDLHTNEKEQELLSPDRSSLQSMETGGSSTPCKGKKGFMQIPTLQKKTKIEPRIIYSSRQVASEKKMQSVEREHIIPSSPDRVSVRSKETNDNHHSQSDANKNLGNQPQAYNAGTHRIINGPSSRKKKYSWENVMSPPVSKDKETYQHKTVLSPSLQRKTAVVDDFASPTFAMDATPPSPPSEKLLNEVFSSHVLAQLRNLTRKNNCTRLFDKSTPGSCESDVNTESSDGGEKVIGTQGRSLQHGKDTQPHNKSSPSPIEDLDTESPRTDDSKIRGFRHIFPDADSPNKSPSSNQRKYANCRKNVAPSSGFRQADNSSPDAGSPKISPFTFRQSKRVNSLKDGKRRIEETNVPHKTSEIFTENSLESDVMELVLVLERLKAKLKLHTGNKSSEMLSAAAEKICLQLQEVESQMQDDVGKFISTGHSKRKRFESTLQGQQETLRLMHEKFKEEINLQLQDCRITLEELEVHQTEYKGSTDRQKASYKKLLMQVEEVMKTELRDTETKIAAIDKEARKKMYGLKHVLKEWMEDGVIR